MRDDDGPIGPFPAGADPDEYDRSRRRLLWRLPMGLYLLGSASDGRANLMTLNWAMQVSVRPKQVAVSIERSALTHELVAASGCFALSLIDREDRAVVRRFVKPAVHDRARRTLNDLGYSTAATGAPIPDLAAGFLDCEVRATLEAGSHTLFVGEVVAAGDRQGDRPVLRMEDTRMSYGG